jgi:hypothetical protein
MVYDDVCFIEGLLRWFKCDFFKWCGKPDCETIRCGGKGPSMEAIGSDSPSGTIITIIILSLLLLLLLLLLQRMLCHSYTYSCVHYPTSALLFED